MRSSQEVYGYQVDKTDEKQPILRARLRELSAAVELRREVAAGSLYQSGLQTVDESMEQARALSLVWTHRKQITMLLYGDIDSEAIEKLRKESEKFIAQAFMISWVDPEVMRNYRARMDAVEVASLVEGVLDASD